MLPGGADRGEIDLRDIEIHGLTAARLDVGKLDVGILGGGMAGNLLARQLARALPGRRIGLFEQRTGYGHAVGESMVEIASNYLIRRLGLSSYLYDRQYPKNGLRYFFDSPGRDTALHEMSEIGSDSLPVYPAFQIDRSRFEGDLFDMNRDGGVLVRSGTRVKDIDLGRAGGPHRIRVSHGATSEAFECRWLVDATGRRRAVARSESLNRPETQLDNASTWGWFEGVGDIDAHGPESFRERIRYTPRRLSTLHFLHRGYWIWFIPLHDGLTSIGVVADKRACKTRFRSDAEFLAFLREHRAVASLLENARCVATRSFTQLAYGTRRFYSPDRWALVGEAAAFPDPFYSPGADFIALGNDFVSDLIARDLGGESDVRRRRRTELYDEFMRFRLEAAMLLYRDQYAHLGSYELGKLKWDFDIGCYYNLWFSAYLHDQHLDLRQIRRQLGQSRFVLSALANFASLFRRVDAHLTAGNTYHRHNRGRYSRGLDCLGFLDEIARPRSDAEVFDRTVAIFNDIHHRALDLLADGRGPVRRAPLPLTSFVGEGAFGPSQGFAAP
jgi:flavin-dependent dehydrogenase